MVYIHSYNFFLIRIKLDESLTFFSRESGYASLAATKPLLESDKWPVKPFYTCHFIVGIEHDLLPKEE